MIPPFKILQRIQLPLRFDLQGLDVGRFIEKFANAKDLNRAQYGRYEKGIDLRLSSIVKVARALEVSLEEIFKGL